MRKETTKKILDQTCEALRAAGYEVSEGQDAWGNLSGLRILLGERLMFFCLDRKYAGNMCIVRWRGGGIGFASPAYCGAELREYLSDDQSILDHFPLIETYEDLPVETEQGVELVKDGVEVFVHVDDDPWHEEALGTLLRLFPQVTLAPQGQGGGDSFNTKWYQRIYIAPTERNLPCTILLPRFRALEWRLEVGRHQSFVSPDEMEAHALKFRGLKELYATMQRVTTGLDLAHVPDTLSAS